MLIITRHRAIVGASSAELGAARTQLAERGYVKLVGLIDASLLERVLETVDRTPFYRRVHEKIGIELCAEPGPASAVLEFLLNDPVVLKTISEIAGCGAIGCFEGRIYRIEPSTEHHDSWHSDVGQDRLLALSLNAGREPYEGGALQIRRADSTQSIAEVQNPNAGDAVLFRVDPALRHRVAPVVGRAPRTAYAGWFRSKPDFRRLITEKFAQNEQARLSQPVRSP